MLVSEFVLAFAVSEGRTEDAGADLHPRGAARFCPTRDDRLFLSWQAEFAVQMCQLRTSICVGGRSQFLKAELKTPTQTCILERTLGRFEVSLNSRLESNKEEEGETS